MGVSNSRGDTAFSLDVSVRDLVEFVLRRGDLRSGHSFTSPSRALEGTRGHQKLQSSRDDHYRAEVALKWVTVRPTFTLTLRGRIDGVRESPRESSHLLDASAADAHARAAFQRILSVHVADRALHVAVRLEPLFGIERLQRLCRHIHRQPTAHLRTKSLLLVCIR